MEAAAMESFFRREKAAITIFLSHIPFFRRKENIDPIFSSFFRLCRTTMLPSVLDIFGQYKSYVRWFVTAKQVDLELTF